MPGELPAVRRSSRKISLFFDGSTENDRLARRRFPSFLTQIVSSQLDADRFDYLQRDSHATGADYGRFDWKWLIHHLDHRPREREVLSEPEGACRGGTVCLRPLSHVSHGLLSQDEPSGRGDAAADFQAVQATGRISPGRAWTCKRSFPAHPRASLPHFPEDRRWRFTWRSTIMR